MVPSAALARTRPPNDFWNASRASGPGTRRRLRLRTSARSAAPEPRQGARSLDPHLFVRYASFGRVAGSERQRELPKAPPMTTSLILLPFRCFMGRFGNEGMLQGEHNFWSCFSRVGGWEVLLGPWSGNAVVRGEGRRTDCRRPDRTPTKRKKLVFRDLSLQASDDPRES